MQVSGLGEAPGCSWAELERVRFASAVGLSELQVTLRELLQAVSCGFAGCESQAQLAGLRLREQQTQAEKVEKSLLAFAAEQRASREQLSSAMSAWPRLSAKEDPTLVTDAIRGCLQATSTLLSKIGGAEPVTARRRNSRPMSPSSTATQTVGQILESLDHPTILHNPVVPEFCYEARQALDAVKARANLDLSDEAQSTEEELKGLKEQSEGLLKLFDRSVVALAATAGNWLSFACLAEEAASVLAATGQLAAVDGRGATPQRLVPEGLQQAPFSPQVHGRSLRSTSPSQLRAGPPRNAAGPSRTPSSVGGLSRSASARGLSLQVWPGPDSRSTSPRRANPLTPPGVRPVVRLFSAPGATGQRSAQAQGSPSATASLGAGVPPGGGAAGPGLGASSMVGRPGPPRRRSLSASVSPTRHLASGATAGDGAYSPLVPSPPPPVAWASSGRASPGPRRGPSRERSTSGGLEAYGFVGRDSGVRRYSGSSRQPAEALRLGLSDPMVATSAGLASPPPPRTPPMALHAAAPMSPVAAPAVRTAMASSPEVQASTSDTSWQAPAPAAMAAPAGVAASPGGGGSGGSGSTSGPGQSRRPVAGHYTPPRSLGNGSSWVPSLPATRVAQPPPVVAGQWVSAGGAASAPSSRESTPASSRQRGGSRPGSGSASSRGASARTGGGAGTSPGTGVGSAGASGNNAAAISANSGANLIAGGTAAPPTPGAAAAAALRLAGAPVVSL